MDNMDMRIMVGKEIKAGDRTIWPVMRIFVVTTPMNKFIGIYGLSPMGCDPNPLSLRRFSLLLESFQLLVANLTFSTIRHEIKKILVTQESQRGTIHPTSEEAGILCPCTPSFLKPILCMR